jgi:hypothetical protein
MQAAIVTERAVWGAEGRIGMLGPRPTATDEELMRPLEPAETLTYRVNMVQMMSFVAAHGFCVIDLRSVN